TRPIPNRQRIECLEFGNRGNHRPTTNDGERVCLRSSCYSDLAGTSPHVPGTRVGVERRSSFCSLHSGLVERSWGPWRGWSSHKCSMDVANRAHCSSTSLLWHSRPSAR